MLRSPTVASAKGIAASAYTSYTSAEHRDIVLVKRAVDRVPRLAEAESGLLLAGVVADLVEALESDLDARRRRSERKGLMTARDDVERRSTLTDDLQGDGYVGVAARLKGAD